MCPITGRTWPSEYGPFLRTCVICHGFIDTRNEGWRDDNGKAMHPGDCPTKPEE
jgi:hypothetical protein